MESRASNRKRNNSGESHASDASYTRAPSRASVCSATESMGRAGSVAENRSRSTTPFLRSQCQKKNCHEGHGIDFRSRISASPKRKGKKKQVDDSSFQVNLTNRFEKTCLTNGHHEEATAIYKNTRVLTSDYGSSDDDLWQSAVTTPNSTSLAGSTLLGTAINAQQLSPIPRSEEKTNYTYAESRSYRNSVTPTRVTYMPNMSRTSLTRHQRLNEEASPTLRIPYSFSLQKTINESREVRTVQQSGNFSLERAAAHVKHSGDAGLDCGPDDDSDLELEADLSSYRLSAQQSKTLFTVLQYYTLIAKFKISSFFTLIGWYTYLTVCWVMWLDTYLLTRKPVSQLRQFVRSHWKALLSLVLLLLCLLLLIAATGTPNLSLPFALLPLLSETHETNAVKILPESSEPAPERTEAITSLHLKDLDALKQSYNDLNRRLMSAEQELVVYKNSVPDLQGKVSTLLGLPRMDCCNDLPSMLVKLAGVNSRIDSLSAVSDTRKEDVAKLWEDQQEIRKMLADFAASSGKLESSEKERTAKLASIWQRLDSLDVSSQELRERSDLIESRVKEGLAQPAATVYGAAGLSAEEVNALIKAALALYDADKTGMADYALEPSGGVILSTRCTESFSHRGAVLSVLGIPLWKHANNPRVVIQPGIVPSQCWSFRGPEGYLVIQLSRMIMPTAFSLEHIPKELSPDGNIDSAPKNFTVWGLEHEKDSHGILLGNYTYNQNGDPLQTFPVQYPSGPFGIIELRIHSNHGNLNYTCLYRFRVHGKPVAK